MLISEFGIKNLEKYNENFEITKKLYNGYICVKQNISYRGCGAVLAFLVSGELKGTDKISNDKLAEKLDVDEKTIYRLKKKDKFRIKEIVKLAVCFNLDFSVSIAMIQYSDIKWYYGEKNFNEEYDKILRLAFDEKNFVDSKSEILKKLKK